MAEGIRTRHSRGCPGGDGCRTTHLKSCASKRPFATRCPCDCGKCTPAFEAFVWDPRTRKKKRKTHATLAAARAWRTDELHAVQRGTAPVQSRETVKQVGSRWLEQVKAGEVLKQAGLPYKPSVVRAYASDLERFVFPELGYIRLSELRRRDVQRFVDELVGRGLSGSRIRGIVMPLRAICRRAIRDDQLAVNPTQQLDLPAADGVRDRVATAEESEVLLAALQDRDRPLWATALYAGLRRGELRALRWGDIDDDVTVITVSRGWDEVEGEIDPKSAKGKRTVPVVKPLRLELLQHKARTGGRGVDLVFGSTGSTPFTPTNIRKRALRAWSLTFACGCKREPPKRMPQWARNNMPPEPEPTCPEHEAPLLRPIGLHECRHSYVSLMHDAGFSLERIGDYVGHSSSYMTDRYRHLLDGHEAEAAERFDEYLTRRTGARTGAQGEVVTLAPHG